VADRAEQADRADQMVDDVNRPATVRLCGREDLADGQARRFDVAGLRVALVRIGDGFYAVGDRCSHEDFSLAEGEVWADECEIECSKHGSTFDLLTGAPCSLPATQPVPVYQVVVEGDDVSVIVP
jgi:3-phenylpropionate/trans-cinnamate dioxygenase ferredoxin subunit